MIYQRFLYDINLRATHTMILSIRGVTIPIYLVSSTTDSIRQCVVLFKPVPIPTSDLKSEFLCQSSSSCAEPSDPLNTLYTWEISHALVTTYHPYCHSPSALTEYLKQKLHVQRAKRLGHSPSAQVKQNVPLKRNRVPKYKPMDTSPGRTRAHVAEAEDFLLGGNRWGQAVANPKRAQNNVREVICFGCNKTGHIAHNCPQKQQ